MRKQVEIVVREYNIYSKSKSNRHLLYGQLKLTLVPKGAWKLIALDFIIKLLPSKDPLTGVEYNSILIIIERLMKYGKFISYLEASDAKALIYTFI
jgi:hypothetical protein